MRMLRRLSALALLLLAAACEDTPTIPEEGRMVARLNGRDWNGDAAVVFARDTVVLRTREPMTIDWASSFSSDSRSWRALALYVVASGPGTYQVVPQKSEYVEIIGGDQIAYRAPVTVGTVRFTVLSRGGTSAAGLVDDVRIEGQRGTWTFDRGGFTGPAVALEF